MARQPTPLLVDAYHRLERRQRAEEVFVCGDDDRKVCLERHTSMGIALGETRMERTSSTSYARRHLCTPVTASLDRTNWHPADHHSPLRTVYTHPLYPLFPRTSFALPTTSRATGHTSLHTRCEKSRTFGEYPSIQKKMRNPYIRHRVQTKGTRSTDHRSCGLLFVGLYGQITAK